MRVLLIRPPWSTEKFYFHGPREPLGLECLASFIKDKHEVKIIDTAAKKWQESWHDPMFPEVTFQGMGLDQIWSEIEAFNPDIIGLSWLLPTQTPGVELMFKLIRQRDSRIKIVVGGPNPSANPRAIMTRYPEIDIVAYGEGEITLLELLDSKLSDLEKINGIAFRRENEIIVNQPRELIKDLNILPLPLRDKESLLNFSRGLYYQSLDYWLKKIIPQKQLRGFFTALLSGFRPLNQFYYFLHNRKPRTDRLPFADIVTSRGCPNHCTFCAIHNTWGHYWRPRSAENVLKEIEILVEQYGIKHINFVDDNFNASRERVIAICRGIVERGYDLTLSAPGIFVPTLNEEVLVWLKKAGMYSLRMSIESGNQNVLNNVIKKNVNLVQIAEAVKICRKIGMHNEGCFILGVPGETIQTMKDTIAYSKDTGFDRVVKFIYQPFPNTVLYDICVAKGYLSADYDPNRLYVTGNQCYVQTEEFSPSDVLRLARE
ncbi:MAG: radical SAM protein [Candidatus Buchananbacteria bacterium]|jgi:magnesium-protoporphyrin IX monomethyl ester (oxidative) cyclase